MDRTQLMKWERIEKLNADYSKITCWAFDLKTWF